MAKLTHEQTKDHQVAESWLYEKYGEPLNNTQKQFILNSWQPSVVDVTAGEAFFTPRGWASAMRQHMSDSGVIIDLCAGIGRLAGEHYIHQSLNDRGRAEDVRYICIEFNEKFVEVGRKLFPNFEWYVGDIHDKEFMAQFHKDELDSDWVGFISNPPFSRRKKSEGSWVDHIGLHTHMVMEMGYHLGWDYGVVLMPSAHAIEYYKEKWVKKGGTGHKSYRERVSGPVIRKIGGFFQKNRYRFMVTGSAFDSYGEHQIEKFLNTGLPVQIQQVNYNTDEGTMDSQYISYSVSPLYKAIGDVY